jgi:hypothetical protein
MSAKTGKKASGPSKSERRLAAATTTVEELTAEVELLRERISTLEAESEAWRRRAAKQKSRVQKIRAAAEAAIAEANAKRKKAKAQARQAIADHPYVATPALRAELEPPQPTWTVARLRAAARDQGLAGYSRMRKDQLVAELI